MNLTEMFYGTFTPPPVTNTTYHRIGFSNGERYTPPKKVVRNWVNPKPNELDGSRKEVYKIMKFQIKPVTAEVIAKKTRWTRNHCSMIMASLFKMGLLTRIKLRQNGTMLYAYSVKKDSNDD